MAEVRARRCRSHGAPSSGWRRRHGAGEVMQEASGALKRAHCNRKLQMFRRPFMGQHCPRLGPPCMTVLHQECPVEAPSQPGCSAPQQQPPHVARQGASDSAPADRLVVRGLAGIFEEMTSALSDVCHISCFHSRTVPDVPISEYVARLFRLFDCGPECFVVALVYMDRATKADPKIAIDALTVHRLLACSLMLAAKFHNDVHHSNRDYARLAGLTLPEMNELERSMLKLLGDRMWVQPTQFCEYRRLLCRAAGGADA